MKLSEKDDKVIDIVFMHINEKTESLLCYGMSKIFI